MSSYPIMINAFDPSRASELPENEQALLARRQRVSAPRIDSSTSTRAFRSRRRVWLYDAEGAAYLDAYNNVPSVGHCHPGGGGDRAPGGSAQHAHPLSALRHIGLSEMLLATFPGELSQVMYTCTGSEANDLAVRWPGNSPAAPGLSSRVSPTTGSPTRSPPCRPRSARGWCWVPTCASCPRPAARAPRRTGGCTLQRPLTAARKSGEISLPASKRRSANAPRGHQAAGLIRRYHFLERRGVCRSTGSCRTRWPRFGGPGACSSR